MVKKTICKKHKVEIKGKMVCPVDKRCKDFEQSEHFLSIYPASFAS